jgi:hypothetical protein
MLATSPSHYDLFVGSLFDTTLQEMARHAARATSPVVELQVGRDERVLPVGYTPLEEKQGELACNDVFEWYRPQSVRFHDAVAHPTALMESIALASTRPPIPRYVAHLPRWLVTSGTLSEAQLETITMAGEAHETLIEIPVATAESRRGTGTKYENATVRQGYMIGDGPGTGKGRTILGIILDARAKGQRRALWISENSRLFNDAMRDNGDLGGNDRELVQLGRFRIDEPITLDAGIIFCSYAMLRSKRSRKDANGTTTEITRLDQIVSWLAGDGLSGVVVFDESQNLQNAVSLANDNAWGTTQPSLQALTAITLQEKLPLARVVYASGTSGDRLEALAYAPRLGLWGTKTAFPTRAAFLAAMNTGGVTALEMICRDLKSTGLYCARQISTAGVTSELVVHRLSDEQLVEMNDFNRTWRAIATSTEAALVATGHTTQSGHGGRNEAHKGSSAHQVRSRLQGAKLQFYSAALVALRMPTVIADMKQRLAMGESCVVQLHHTQEAALSRAIERWEKTDEADRCALGDVDVTMCTDLVEFIESFIPTTQQKLRFDSKTREWVVAPEIDPLTNLPVENAQAQRIKRNLILSIKNTMMPRSALDLLIEAFGTDVVAEVTGRSRRIVLRPNDDGVATKVIERRTGRANAKEIDAFMNGPKRILVFSDSSGGVGASYHASLTCSNQTKRNHYIVEIPWRSIDAIQGMGRTHRTNQRQPPHYILATTNLPCERRFFSILVKRLDDLGSLTRGQRDATATNDLFGSVDDLQGPYGREALKHIMMLFADGSFPHMTAADLYEQMGIDALAVKQFFESNGKRGQNIHINRFLTRLLGVDVDAQGGMQKLLLDALVGTIEDKKADAIAKGTYDAGLQLIEGRSIRKIDDEVLVRSAASNQQTRVATIVRETAVVHTDWDWTSDRLRFHRDLNGTDPDADWFVDANGMVGLHVPRLLDQNVRIIRPFGESQRKRASRDKYTRISEESAKALWVNAITTNTKTETSEFLLVYGRLLPIWKYFKTSMPTVWRLITDDGERLLGLVIPKKDGAKFKAECEGLLATQGS